MALKATLDEIESKLTEIDTQEVAHVLGNARPDQLRIIVDYLRRRREHRMRDVKVIDTQERIELMEGDHVFTITKGPDPPVRTLSQHIRERTIMSQMEGYERRPSRSRAIYEASTAERCLRGFVRVLRPRELPLREFVHYVTLDGNGRQAFYRGGVVIRKDADALQILINTIIYPVPYMRRVGDLEFETVFFRRQDFSEDEFVPLRNLMGDMKKELEVMSRS